jgi:hypothetical protein
MSNVETFLCHAAINLQSEASLCFKAFNVGSVDDIATCLSVLNRNRVPKESS